MPKNTINLLLRMYLLTRDSGPDWMMAADARVGNTAHQPGYRFRSLKMKEEIKIVISPVADRA